MTFMDDMMGSLYSPGEFIENLNRLFVVQRGVGTRNGAVLLQDSIWGEDMVLENDTLKDQSPVYTLTIMETWSISRTAMLHRLQVLAISCLPLCALH